MKNCIKLLIMVSAASALVYAQSANSTVKQGASPGTVNSAGAVTGVTISPTNTQKFIAHTAPTTKTNWSKVKDLFL
jgi:hypothetical protein